jgi:hypothetical protein
MGEEKRNFFIYAWIFYCFSLDRHTYTHARYSIYMPLSVSKQNTWSSSILFIALSTNLLNYLWIYQLDICHDDDVRVVIVQFGVGWEEKKILFSFLWRASRLSLYHFFCGKFLSECFCISYDFMRGQCLFLLWTVVTFFFAIWQNDFFLSTWGSILSLDYNLWGLYVNYGMDIKNLFFKNLRNKIFFINL